MVEKLEKGKNDQKKKKKKWNMCDGCKKNIKNININGYKINIG